ncbi:MAG: hypothetical protein ACYC3K_13510 [Candidatus Nanopelagicales bacterium]
MRINKWVAGAGVGAMLATAWILGAPPASAALCGYPPVECGTDTNPPTEQPIGETPRAQAQAGMTLPSQGTADDTPPTPPPAPPSVNAIGEAPKIPATRGDVVKVRTDVEPGVTYRVKVKRNAGPYNFVGTVTGGPGGKVNLPAVQFDRKGLYTLALEDGDGSTFYVKVNID